MMFDTLTSPIVLFFVLGFVAAIARSDLTIPESFAKSMSIYLMASIGLKGGVEVARTGLTHELVTTALAGFLLSLLVPFLAHSLLRTFGRLSKVDAAAVAAHYGSASMVTFLTAREVLTEGGMRPAAFMIAVLAVMETPAILSGLFLARRGEKRESGEDGRGFAHEILTNASVVLLLGAFMIGLVAGEDGFAPVKPLFDSGFRGVLCLFLLDMGLVAARRMIQSSKLTLRLTLLAIGMPLIHGAIGTFIGTWLGLDVGSAAALGVLAASSSYIAVPAAMRLALPEADPGIYLSMSLGITFPFNVLFGISIMATLARALG